MSDKTGDLMNRLTSTESAEDLDHYLEEIRDKYPGRDKIIAIAIACNMNLTECQRALEIAQEGILYAKSRRDSLIIYAINKKMSIMELNGLLEQYSLASLA